MSSFPAHPAKKSDGAKTKKKAVKEKTPEPEVPPVEDNKITKAKKTAATSNRELHLGPLIRRISKDMNDTSLSNSAVKAISQIVTFINSELSEGCNKFATSSDKTKISLKHLHAAAHTCVRNKDFRKVILKQIDDEKKKLLEQKKKKTE